MDRVSPRFRTLGDPRLERVSVAPLTPPMTASTWQAAMLRIEAGGRVARHPATVPQLLLVLDGTVTVRGGEGPAEQLQPHGAVHWRAGEVHEVWSEAGATVLVLEGAGLAPPVR